MGQWDTEARWGEMPASIALHQQGLQEPYTWGLCLTLLLYLPPDSPLQTGARKETRSSGTFLQPRSP